MDSRLRIIVSGLVGASPVGGMAWHYLQYVVGLARLGHDVCYHEDTWMWPFHPVENCHTSDGTYSAAFIDRFFRDYAPDLVDRWHYRHLHDESFGMSQSAFESFAASADLLINVSGASLFPECLPADCVTAFVDTDPGYNQIVYADRPEWSENVDRWCEAVDAHDRHFTFAENIHSGDCTVPATGIEWTTTRMPVVLDLWSDLEQSRPHADSPWSTIMTWNAFKGPLVHEGREYFSKGTEFDKFVDMPSRVDTDFRLAVGGKSAPRERLVDAGWEVQDGPAATRTAAGYREFLARSRAEFSTAKHVYVTMRTGWFSERSTCYLAAGRPCVLQDTGFARYLPTGAGLLAFDDVEAACAAVEQVESDYDRHAVAAREIAASEFGSDLVLSELIDNAMSVGQGTEWESHPRPGIGSA